VTIHINTAKAAVASLAGGTGALVR
jgi:hypothetical protein